MNAILGLIALISSLVPLSTLGFNLYYSLQSLADHGCLISQLHLLPELLASCFIWEIRADLPVVHSTVHGVGWWYKNH